MRVRRRRENKILTSVGAGLLVWIVSAAGNYLLVPGGRADIVRQVVANFIGGLMTIIVSLALHLRSEEVHYASALQRAALLAELNHHVRNAVFPLCLAVQKTNDAEITRLADEAVERINSALRDATADALSRRVEYSEEQPLNVTAA